MKSVRNRLWEPLKGLEKSLDVLRRLSTDLRQRERTLAQDLELDMLTRRAVVLVVQAEVVLLTALQATNDTIVDAKNVAKLAAGVLDAPRSESSGLQDTIDGIKEISEITDALVDELQRLTKEYEGYTLDEEWSPAVDAYVEVGFEALAKVCRGVGWHAGALQFDISARFPP